MRMTRIHTPEPLRAPGRTTLQGTAATHVSRVLRLRAGDVVVLFNGDGWDYGGQIVALRQGEVEVELQSREAGIPDPPLAVTLMQGIARGERMDLGVLKATERRVGRSVPGLAARSVVRLDGRQAQRKLEHWQGVAIAACEQSGRARLPVIEPAAPLEQALQLAAPEGSRITLAPGAGASRASLATGTKSVTLLIGPEGGLTEAEIALARGAGFEPRSLGPRVLRTETAALAALAVLQAVGGDLR
jgi:16S rRNA (uracil1498-N3)-methyltransferase